jgi:hypothetical protein
MQIKGSKISLIDKIKFLSAEPIQENPSVLKNILGVPVVLEEISGAWEDQGIFVENPIGEYLFLSRDYSDPKKNGRGNIIMAKTISSKDIVLKTKNNYLIRFLHGGSGAIFDESDLEFQEVIWDLKKGYIIYDKLLKFAGIYPTRIVN